MFSIISRKIYAQSFVAYHGTSNQFLPTIRKNGLNYPYLAKTIQLAQYYAQEAVSDKNWKPVVLMVTVPDISKLRYDRKSMDEPVLSDDTQRNIEWNRAVKEHPEWYDKSNNTVSIPSTAWEYSWKGVGVVMYQGIILPKNIRVI